MLSTALGLIKFAPQLIGLLNPKRGKQATEMADKISGIAEALTGQKGDAAVQAISQDPELAYKFQTAVMADSHVAEQLEAEDRKDARGAYKIHNEQADKVAQSIMVWNLPVVFSLAAMNVAAVFIAETMDVTGAVIAVISNLIGLVSGKLLSERQSVVGFFFGSSMGSKLKSLPKEN
jgi:hypothetical protein